MAIQWGAWKKLTAHSFRIGIDLSYSPSNVTSATVSVTVTAKLYINTSSFSSGSDSWNISGTDSLDNSGTKSWSTSTGGTALIGTATESYTLSYSGTKSVSANGAMYNVAGTSGDLSCSANFTIPKRPVVVPAPVTGLTGVVVNDGRIDLDWTNNGASGAPYDKIEVRRRDNVNDYRVIARIHNTYSAYSDRTVRSDREYRYAVRPYNDAGYAAFVYPAENLDTTPARPGAPVAKRTAAGDIEIVPPSFSEVAATWQFRAVRDGVVDETVLGTSAVGTASRLDASPNPLVTHAYQVRARSDNPVLNSEWSPTSNTVQLITAPAAPTGLLTAPVSGDQDLLEVWTHNPVDTTDQTAFEYRYRVSEDDGVTFGAWVSTGQVLSAVSAYLVPAATWTNGTLVERQVRTWGEADDPSPWSDGALRAISSQPPTEIVAPGDVLDTSTITLEWQFFDAESSPQSKYLAHLYAVDDSLIESLSGDGDTMSVTFGTRAEDGQSYRVTVEAADGTLHWSDPAEQVFTVDYAEPPQPVVTVRWDGDEGRAVVSAEVPEPAVGETEALYVNLYRAQGDRWLLIADELEPGSATVDQTPPLGTAVAYQAVAVSELGSTSLSVATPVETTSRYVFVNFGVEFSRVVRLWADLSASRSVGREKVLHRFAGRTAPVEYAGEGVTRSYELSAKRFAPWHDDGSMSSWDELDAVALAGALVCVRDPEGTRLFCSVGDIPESSHLEQLREVSLSLTEVDWSERLVDSP